MSFWSTVSTFIKKVLHRDDDYSLCRYHIKDCEGCPKLEKCKKTSLASIFSINKSISQHLKSSNGESEKFSFSYDDHVMLIKFGQAYIELCEDGNITIHGQNVMVDGNLSTSTGASGAICLLTTAIVQNGIVKGIV